MEQKFETYKRYGWAGDKKWQMYLNNLYPVPDVKSLEKRRRKWWKKEKDPDFDIEWEPRQPGEYRAQSTNDTQQQQQPRPTEQQRFHQQYQQQFEQQNPGAAYAARQNNYVDKVPALNIPILVCFVAYIGTFPLGFMTFYLVLAGNIMSTFRKSGMPKFSIEFMQSIVFLDEFSNLTYLMSIATTPKQFFVHTPLLISAVLLLSVEFKRILDKKPNTPILSTATVKQWVMKGSDHAIQDYGRCVKADTEIYVGFYLVVMVFVGSSSIVSVFLFWQMMRMRYMMNQSTQMAFQRLDQNIQVKLAHPYVPTAVLGMYAKGKGLLSGLVDTQGTQQRVQENGGGMMGALKSSCNIF